MAKEIGMTETVTTAKPGDWMEDGTIYAGISPDTHQPMYTTPKDERVNFFLGRREPKLIFTFSEALKHASKLKFCGHKDWRVPTKNELNELFNNRAAIGGFCEIDHFDYGPYYWDRLTMNAPPLPDAWRSS